MGTMESLPRLRVARCSVLDTVAITLSVQSEVSRRETMTSKATNEQFIEAAKRRWQDDGEIEVDDGAEVSRNNAPKASHGAYVQAWVWVDNDDIE